MRIVVRFPVEQETPHRPPLPVLAYTWRWTPGDGEIPYILLPTAYLQTIQPFLTPALWPGVGKALLVMLVHFLSAKTQAPHRQMDIRYLGTHISLLLKNGDLETFSSVQRGKIG